MVGGRASDRALIDYVLLPKQMRLRLLDVNVCREVGGRMSDHFLVEAGLKVVGGWSVRRMDGERNVMKVSEPNQGVKERAYQENLHVKCCVVKMSKV